MVLLAREVLTAVMVGCRKHGNRADGTNRSTLSVAAADTAASIRAPKMVDHISEYKIELSHS